MHPEERRIAGLLRELIVDSGSTLEVVEERLGWEPGLLAGLLEGKERLAFDDIFELLPEVGATPAEFFAWLYGFESHDGHAMGILESGDGIVPQVAARTLDQRFDKSLKVVRRAIERRKAWKAERGEG